jgi:N-acetylglucosaminyl-diphospho-decaprenol L-rhamnosyltransferase
MTASDALSVVVVTYNSAQDIGATLAALLPQLRPDDEIVVVDNASTDGTPAAVRDVVAQARLVPSGANLGFAGGVNLGVAEATNPLLLLLNPDAEVLPGCVDVLRATAADEPRWGAWQALVVLPNGSINTSGGRVHFLGFGWAGNWGEPRAAAPTRPEEVGFASGAAMCLRRAAWDDVGGFDPSYFMYGEDLDLSLRIGLRGWGVGIAPEAVVRHDYEFERGAWKWFHLERNRLVTILVTYPTTLLAALAPAFVAFEVAILALAVRGGWGRAKVRSWRSAARHLPAIRERRRQVQERAVLGPGAFAERLTAHLDGAYFAGLRRHRWLTALLEGYWRATVRLAVLASRGE